MIQRIQSVYLVLIIVLGIVLLVEPVLLFTTPTDAAQQRMWEFGATGLDEITPNLDMLMLEPAHLRGSWGLLLTSALIPFLALVDLFLFKRRILQARLNIFLALLCVGYYGILYMYVWFAQMNLGVDWHILFWAGIPLVCFVLTLMATRRILADEALVRAADRLR